jgi:hypothetical protein
MRLLLNCYHQFLKRDRARRNETERDKAKAKELSDEGLPAFVKSTTAGRPREATKFMTKWEGFGARRVFEP